MTPQLRLYTGDDEPLDDAPPQQETIHANGPARTTRTRDVAHGQSDSKNRDIRPAGGRGVRPNGQLCTEAQRRAIFAAARRADLTIHELRDLCPNHSVSKLTVAEAAELLTRLNKGTRYERDKPPRKPRRAAGTIAFVTDDQHDIIARFRIAMGWTHDDFESHLHARAYISDPSRTMDDMTTSADAQAVIEHLKKVLYRMLALHSRKLTNANFQIPDPDAKHIPDGLIKSLMAMLPPHDRLCDLYTDRIKRLARRLGDSQQIVEQRLASQRCTNGRLMSAIASCADMAEAVLYLEQELARTPQTTSVPCSPFPVPTGTEAAHAANA